MKKYCFILFLVITSACIASAQTVEEFIRMAYEYSPELKSLNLEYQAALKKADQVKDWPDPTINLGIGVLPVETRLGPQLFRVGATQMIPWKGLINAKSDVAISMAETKSLLDELKEIDIEYAIRTTYFTMSFLESKKEIQRERLQVLEVLEELSKSAVRSGRGQLSDVLLIERKRKMIEADLQLLDTKMKQPKIMLNRWTGRSLDTEVNLIANLPETLDREKMTAFANENHPQFQIIDQQIQASNANIALTRFESKPKIGVGLDYAYVARRRDVEMPGNGRDILMPMGTITIPLHTGRFDAVRQEERIRQEALAEKRKGLSDGFQAEMSIAYAASEYAEEVFNKYEDLKEITREVLKLMRTEYASEGTRFEELLKLEMELIDYNLEILMADYERNMAMAILQKYN